MSATTEVIPPPVLLLHVPSDGFNDSPEGSLSRLRNISHAVTRQQGGVDLVGHVHGEVEREISTDERSRPHDRVGCFISEVGSILPE